MAVLAIPPLYAVDYSATGLVQSVAWALDGSAYGAITNFPGLCIGTTTYQDSFAVEALLTCNCRWVSIASMWTAMTRSQSIQART